MKKWIHLSSRVEDDTEYCQFIRIHTYKCPHCGYLTEIQHDECPQCSKQLISIGVT